MSKFNNTFNKLIKEEQAALSPDEIFEVYEDVGMSADIAMLELIDSTIQHILKEVPPESQASARTAVKNLWMTHIRNWTSFRGFNA